MKIYKITILLICLILTTMMISCRNAERFDDKSSRKSIVDNSSLSDNKPLLTDMTPYDRRASMQAQEIDRKFPGGIMGVTAAGICFEWPLLQFYYINGYCPHDVGEFLDSGLPLVWPSDSRTGEPLKLVSVRLKPVETDLGKICYVRESDNSAFFEIVYPENGGYGVYSFPEIGWAGGIIKTWNENMIPKDEISEDGFYDMMRSLVQGTFFRAEYWKLGNSPENITEALTGNYFFIKENMLQSHFSKDPSKASFAEWGTAVLDGKPVYFLEIRYSKKHKKFNEKLKSRCTLIYPMASGLSSKVPGCTDPDWNRLTDKKIFFSTKMLLEGILNLPQDVLISKADIFLN